MDNDEYSDDEVVTGDGSDIKLKYKYTLWANNPSTTDWKAKDIKVVTISTVSEFWRLFNNFNKMGAKYERYYLMKDGVEPRFEDKENRNGGVLSIKIDDEKLGLKLYEYMCVSTMVNKLLKDDVDDVITGICINPRKDSLFIKIWNKNGDVDMTNNLNPDIYDKIKDFSMQYKKNIPEY